MSIHIRNHLIEQAARERYNDGAATVVRAVLRASSSKQSRLDDPRTEPVSIANIAQNISDEDNITAGLISKVVMMPNKDVRPLLSALAADYLISTQEVAKSADHNPTRTFYLWYVDLQKAYSVILGHLYKTLYNIGVRRQAEQEDSSVKAVLDKTQRSDVAADMNLLTPMEQETLKEWETKRQKLMILQMRVEEAVFIIKDLAVLGSSDD
ncbi:hypothetical protein ONZ45_g10420 [Pleurotus djamor]|nr:hypothetical protein ONZ45_g10420 [Pleurotus djamor]